MKIVINDCYGGFGLSNKAFELYLKKKGIKWVEKSDTGVCYTYYTIPKTEYDRMSEECFKRDGNYQDVQDKGYTLTDSDIPRNDLTLIEVVEELGEKANAIIGAELKIIEIPDNTTWEISENEGLEKLIGVEK